MRSVAFLDVVNGLTMLGGVGIALVYLLGRAGGVGTALSSVRPDQLTLFGAMSPGQAVALFLPTMCLLLGEANMYQKFFSARDERAARLAVAGWIAGTIVVESMIVGLGLLGSVAIPGLGIVESETIVVRIATDLLPSVIGAVLLAGMRRHHRVDREQHAPQPRDQPGSRRLPAISQARGLARRDGPRHPPGDRRASAPLGLVAGSFFPTVLSMASVGLHDVWRRHHAGPDCGVSSGREPRPGPAPCRSRPGCWSPCSGSSWPWRAEPPTTPHYLLGIQTIYPALVASVGTLILLTVNPGFAGSRFGRGWGCEVSRATGSAFISLFRGAPPPRNAVGPHPHSCQRLASLGAAVQQPLAAWISIL